jgi:hypothetical protein
MSHKQKKVKDPSSRAFLSGVWLKVGTKIEPSLFVSFVLTMPFVHVTVWLGFRLVERVFSGPGQGRPLALRSRLLCMCSDGIFAKIIESLSGQYYDE